MFDAFGNPQSALVLGGTSEIGLATVHALAEHGLRRVVLAGRAEASLEAAATRLRSRGIDVAVERLDIADLPDPDAWMDGVVERHGCFDLFLFAFGVLGDQEQAREDASEGVRIATTNYVGTVGLGLAAGRHVVRCGYGVIVVLSSVAAVRPRPSNFVYGSSKAGADAFARGLGDALHGVGRVIVVRAGFVRTKMTAGMPDAPLATSPEAVAARIVDALHGRKDVVYAPAAVRVLALALQLVPRAVLRKLPI